MTTPLQWKMWKSVACQHVSRCRNIMSYKLPTSCKSPAMLQRWGSRAVPPTAMGNLCFSTTDDRHIELCYGFFGNIAQVATAQLNDSHSAPMDPESCQVWYVPSGALRETGASGRWKLQPLQPLQPDTPQCSTASKPWEVVARARSDDEARIAPHSQSVLQIIRYEFHMIHCEKQLTPAVNMHICSHQHKSSTSVVETVNICGAYLKSSLEHYGALVPPGLASP